MAVNQNNKKSFREIMKEECEGELVLPDFQRGFVWSVEQQKALVATFLSQIPLTSLLLLKGRRKDFGYKRLCVKNNDSESTLGDGDNQCIFLLDGQQRLSTLKNVFSDLYRTDKKWDEVFDKIDNKLRYRWFLNLKPKNKADEEADNDDIFGVENLSKPKALNTLEPGELLGYITCEKITKKDLKKKDKIKWWHPAFMELTDSKSPGLECTKKSAEEYLIPLYKFYDDGNLNVSSRFKISTTISQIAKNRIEELKEEIENGNKRKENVFIGELKQLYDENPDEAWSNLMLDWLNAMNKTISDTIEQMIYFIELDRDEIGRAVTIFENMNASGTKLSVFDLVVARAASRNADDVSLSLSLIEKLNSPIEIPKSIGVNCNVKVNISSAMKLLEDNKLNTNFKNVYISMLAIIKKINDNNGDMKISSDDIKQNKILKLTPDEIYKYTDKAIESLKRAYIFLQYRCGILSIDKISYRLMVLPIACVLLDDNNWNNSIIIDRIECWYWSSIFAGSYASNQNARSVEDIKKLYEFTIKSNIGIFNERIKGIFSQGKYSDLNTLLGKNEDLWTEAMHQGILSYVLSTNPPDFQIDSLVTISAWEGANKTIKIVDNKKFEIELHDHHLIPIRQNGELMYRDSETKLRKDKSNILNSPLNRTYVTADANRRISKDKIDSYMEFICGYGREYHFIPNKKILKCKKDTDLNSYYEKVLTERFKLLKSKMEDELKMLQHKECFID